MALLAPSILSADFLNLKSDIEFIHSSQADWIHVDIMDGVFVPNISIGLPVVKAIKPIATKPLDVHLMIVQPERYIAEFVEAGADILTVHYEASTHLNRSIELIKKLGIKAGVSLNPHTPVSSLEHIIEMLDLVLIMSVNPGFGGQTFIEETYSKIEQVVNLRNKKNSKALIEIDGGVNEHNAATIIQAGADVLVMGNAIFSSPDREKTINNIKKI